jgi:predicted metal-binding protein
VDECERVIHSYRYAIIFQLDVPVEDFTGKDWPSKSGRHFLSNNAAVGHVEALANSMGYRQAVGFQGGPCLMCGGMTAEYLEEKDASNRLSCAVLQGGTCRNFLKARPAMEAMAIDVIGTVQPLGWNLVYIGGSTNDPDDIPCASTVGIVMVC